MFDHGNFNKRKLKHVSYLDIQFIIYKIFKNKAGSCAFHNSTVCMYGNVNNLVSVLRLFLRNCGKKPVLFAHSPCPR